MPINQRTDEVSGASLAMFRVVFGAVGVVSMVRLVAYGWVESLYSGPAHHFTYPGLAWVRPPDDTGMYILVAAVGLSALAVCLGLWTRPALAVFLFGFTWIEFIDVTTYLNHYWFVTLAGAALLFAPVDTCLAVHRRPRPVPRYWVWLLRFLVGSVYVYAGLAKLDADWLIHGLPLRLWLPARSGLPVLGGLFEEPATAIALSWAGALFDCTIVALLCWRRTRPLAWLLVIAFHVSTWLLFPIGVFPWLMIGATTIFFEPDWPERVMVRLGRRWRAPVAAATTTSTTPARPWVPVLLAGWVLVLVVLPLRDAVIPGDGRWTGEGYRFSWNVLLTEKGADVRFHVTDLATGTKTIDTAEDLYTPLQWKVMSSDPELIRQAAHAIAAERRALGQDVAVTVDAFVSLNGRPAARLIDPTVDLSREPYRLLGQPWILPAPTAPPS